MNTSRSFCPFLLFSSSCRHPGLGRRLCRPSQARCKASCQKLPRILLHPLRTGREELTDFGILTYVYTSNTMPDAHSFTCQKKTFGRGPSSSVGMCDARVRLVYDLLACVARREAKPGVLRSTCAAPMRAVSQMANRGKGPKSTLQASCKHLALLSFLSPHVPLVRSTPPHNLVEVNFCRMDMSTGGRSFHLLQYYKPSSNSIRLGTRLFSNGSPSSCTTRECVPDGKGISRNHQPS